MSKSPHVSATGVTSKRRVAPKTAVRGGYRMAYNRLVNWALNVVEQNQPGTTRTSILRPNSSASQTNPPAVRANDPAVQTLVQQLPAGIVGLPVQRIPPPDRSSTPLLFESNLRTPFVHQWNFSIQRELFKAWVLELGYVGTHGNRLIGTGRPLNAGQICTAAVPCIIPPEIGSSVNVPGGTKFVTKNPDGSFAITGSNGDNIDARVQVQFLGLSNSRGFFQGQEGNSIYHSLQATLSHQFSGGVYFQGAYTWSKAIDNSSGSIFGDELNGLTQYGDYFNSRANRGPADFDRTHRLVVSYNYELPFAKLFHIDNHGLGKVAHGWSINGVTTFQSGSPITVFDASAVTLQDTDGINTTNFALLASGATLASANTSGSIQSRLGDYLNLGAFATGGNCVNNQNVVVPSAGPTCTGSTDPNGPFTAIGNVSRNAYRGPFQQNWDMSLMKTTNVTERMKVEFRAEFFNAWNHPVFNSPGVAGLGSPTGNLGLVDISGGAGSSAIVSTANRPRIIQFALLFKF